MGCRGVTLQFASLFLGFWFHRMIKFNKMGNLEFSGVTFTDMFASCKTALNINKGFIVQIIFFGIIRSHGRSQDFLTH